MGKSSRKATQFVTVVVKIIIIAVAAFFVWSRLSKDWHSLASLFSIFEASSLYIYIAILLLLTTINWGLDILRWKTLVQLFFPISFFRSLEQTLAAHVSAFVTTAKAGEFGTKALLFPKPSRKKIIALNFLANMYQLTATVVFGVVGITTVCILLKPEFLFVWTITALTLTVFALLVPRNLNRLRWSVKGYSWQRVREFVRQLPKKSKHLALLLSLLKYFVFTHQFYYLLTIFEATISYPIALALIMSMYLLSSLLPVMQLFDVLVRSGIAVLLFGWVQVEAGTILIITTTMWLCNVVLPLILGSYFLLRLRSDKIPVL